jgi:hypothetical protein
LRSPIKTRKDTIPHRLPTSVPIRSIVFATPPEATTAFGWAASGWNDGNEERTERPVILETRDGGKTWEWLKYRWLPAPWVYVALLLAIGAFWRGTAAHVELSRQKEKPRIAEHGVSDDPIGLSDPDALGLAPIARAMSRFLRNVQTEPSLAVGVTGPWGSGKSSLMNLVRQDLEDRGVRSVWFNAWHHQREESLLAALLMTIRAQAVPPIWSWSGWRARFYRLWSRATVNPLGTVAVLVVLVGLAVLLGWLTKIYGKELLKWWFTSGEHSWAGFAGKIGLSTTAIALVGGLWQLFKPFSTTPAKLLATLQGRSNNKDLELQLTFRYRFAREFSAFCAALRHPPNPGLVIFVDDLDRCGSRQTVDVLESLNFVTTAGKCFVILGFEEEKVKAAIADVYKETLLELDQTASGNFSKPQKEDLYRFATRYLEKLVHLVVPVPRTGEDTVEKLLGLEPVAVPSRWQRQQLWFRHLMGEVVSPVLVLLATIGIAVCLVFLVVPEIQSWMPNLAIEQTKQPDATISGSTGQTSEPPKSQSQGSEPNNDSGWDGKREQIQLPAVRLSRIGSIPGWLLVFIVLAALCVPVALLGRRLFTETVVDDSPHFREALRIWGPLIALRRRTPRAVKRFMNRLRFLAMRLRDIEEENGTLGPTLDEPLLVTFAAMDEVNEPRVRTATEDGEGNWESSMLRLQQGIAEYRSMFHRDVNADPFLRELYRRVAGIAEERAADPKAAGARRSHSEARKKTRAAPGQARKA